jgi:predicted nucleic acid-binding protein
MARVVVDTNIIFSAMLNMDSAFAKEMLHFENEFYICETTLVEIFTHKEKLTKVSRLSSPEMAHLYHILVKRFRIYKEELISPGNWQAAYRLCCDVDEADTPHVALALEVNALLWTGDKHLKEGLAKKGFKNFFVP